jgi:hypothetical protein
VTRPIAAVASAATRHVAASVGANGTPWAWSGGMPANDRMAGFTKMM